MTDAEREELENGVIASTVGGIANSNEEIADVLTRFSIFVRRFEAGELRKVVKLYQTIADDLAGQILKRDPTAVKGSYALKRLKVLLEEVTDTITKANGKLSATVNDALYHVAKLETEAVIKGLELVDGLVKVDFILPSANQVKGVLFDRPFQGRFLKDYWKELGRQQAERVKADIRIGVLEGESIQQIAKRVRTTTSRSARSAVALTRTAVTHSSNSARKLTYDENESVIKGVRWVSTLDGRTSAICRARDGMVYPVDKGPRPPAHINCRSSTVPVLKSWKELGLDLEEYPVGTRASMNGQVPDNLNYNDWLKKQPVEFQEELLGKTKADLFRKGGITMDQFVDRAGVEYTLDQLREKFPDAFKKAGV